MSTIKVGHDTIKVDDLIDALEVIFQLDEVTDTEWELVRLGREIETSTFGTLDDYVGFTLVRDDAYEDFARQLAEDEGIDIPAWLDDSIDWDDVGERLAGMNDEVSVGSTTYALVEPI